jgi:hypothetical protein
MQKKGIKALAAVTLAVGIVASFAAPASAATVSCQARITASATQVVVDNTVLGAAAKCYQVQARAYLYSNSGGYSIVKGSLSTSRSILSTAQTPGYGQFFGLAVIVSGQSVTPWKQAPAGTSTLSFSGPL